MTGTTIFEIRCNFEPPVHPKRLKQMNDNEEQNQYEVVPCVPFQRCPICNGIGQIPAQGTSSVPFFPCTVCNGAKIIPMSVMLEYYVSKQ